MSQSELLLDNTGQCRDPREVPGRRLNPVAQTLHVPCSSLCRFLVVPLALPAACPAGHILSQRPLFRLLACTWHRAIAR